MLGMGGTVTQMGRDEMALNLADRTDLTDDEAKTVIGELPLDVIDEWKRRYQTVPVPLGRIHKAVMEVREDTGPEPLDCPYDSGECYVGDRCFECAADAMAETRHRLQEAAREQ